VRRKPTSTSAFGASRRESHDSSPFYRRFTPPVLSAADDIYPDKALDKLVAGDSRHMAEVPSSSVALVVTSPPYFAGKEYEQALGEGGVPGSYLEYLGLLRDVFAECVGKLEPGGRIAVNVANLGRRPYRSLSADVTAILQDDLRLLLRGEIIWLKQRGAAGSCAWGSFQQPANPVLRDLTERVIVASKGRFDRGPGPAQRRRRGLPHQASMTREDFMEGTLDTWELPAESATRVGHPAPFPVELPARLIDLYTYVGDLVLDPFVGSGTTAVAALRSGRHYVGYDSDGGYIELAARRVAEEAQRLSPVPGRGRGRADGALVGPWAAAIAEGRSGRDVARSLLEEGGFRGIQEDQPQPGGVRTDFTALDRRGRLWLFDAAGPHTTYRGGLRRSDVLWRALGKAAVLSAGVSRPYVLLSTGLPSGPGAAALAQATGPKKAVRAVIDMLSSTAPEQVGQLYRA
jgi:DNA modification methylase